MGQILPLLLVFSEEVAHCSFEVADFCLEQGIRELEPFFILLHLNDGLSEVANLLLHGGLVDLQLLFDVDFVVNQVVESLLVLHELIVLKRQLIDQLPQLLGLIHLFDVSLHQFLLEGLNHIIKNSLNALTCWRATLSSFIW